jgi:hypothetical protein
MSNGHVFEPTSPWVPAIGASGGGVLLPTPVVNDMGRGKTPEQWDSWTAEMKAKHGNGNGHGKSLSIEVLRLLPTPTMVDSKVFGPTIDWEKRLAKHAPHTASVLMGLRLNDGSESSDG